MKDPAALIYTDKWIAATQGMRVEAKSWYLELILFQYDKGGLPNNIDELASICRIRPSEFNLFKQVFEQVLKQKFKINENGYLENEFAKEIIQKRKSFKDKRSNSGKLSYFLKFINSNYNVKEDKINFIKKNINLTDVDLKDKQMLKQVFKQISELYINENEDVNKGKDEVKKSFKPNNSEIVFNSLEELQEELLNSEIWLQELSQIYNIPTEEVVVKLNIFLKEQSADDDKFFLIRSLTEIKKHFRNTLKLNIVKEKGSLEKPTYKTGKPFPKGN